MDDARSSCFVAGVARSGRGAAIYYQLVCHVVAGFARSGRGTISLCVISVLPSMHACMPR